MAEGHNYKLDIRHIYVEDIILSVINRPGVAGAVLQTPMSLIYSLID